ncbi:MAG: aspartate carbamoyltransferase, partial [Acidobacteriota bacterium]|nr:aspartate carbamoyltransferase [Acidobacteriota bacterium]
RVARSNILLMNKLGATVTVCGPPTMLPRGVEQLGCRVVHRVEEAVEGADVVMVLRIQLERMHSGFFPTLREYARLYGLTSDRARRAADDAIIMHPGPINRGVEIMSDVADGIGSVILEQVTNGVAVRMAVLYLLSGGVEREVAA